MRYLKAVHRDDIEFLLEANARQRQQLLRAYNEAPVIPKPPKEPCVCGKPNCSYEKFEYTKPDGSKGTAYGCGNDDCDDCYG